MIGFRAGSSPLHRAHPYTPLAIATALLCLAFSFDKPAPILALAVAGIVMALFGQSLGSIARPALALALPSWALLLVLHGLLGHDLNRALVLGGRITAILFAFLTVLNTVRPARLVEAMTEREVPFGVMYLLVSTLTLVPRLRARAAQILEAQQCRGLPLGGSPFARVAALGPLVLPLVLGALMEVDEQVLALDTRGAGRGVRGTALDPPRDSSEQLTVRWLCGIAVAAAWTARVAHLIAPLGMRLTGGH